MPTVAPPQDGGDAEQCVKCGSAVEKADGCKFGPKTYHIKCLCCSQCGENLFGRSFIMASRHVFCDTQCKTTFLTPDFSRTNTPTTNGIGQVSHISPGPAPPPYPSPGPAPPPHSSSGPAHPLNYTIGLAPPPPSYPGSGLSHHPPPSLQHPQSRTPPWMLPQERVSAMVTSATGTVSSSQSTPSLPYNPPLSHNDSFSIIPTAIKRSGSLSSRSDISFASESSFTSYTHDPHKKPKKNILRKPNDRQGIRPRKKNVTWNNEPSVSYIEAEEDNFSVCSSEYSYLPPSNPYWMASNHMGRWRDEDGREMLVHQRWMADNKTYSHLPFGYPIFPPQAMKTPSIQQGSSNVAAARKRFIDEYPLPIVDPLNRVNPVMMAPPSHFPDDDMSDICSETGSELSLEARTRVDDKRSARPQASVENHHPMATSVVSHADVRAPTVKEASPQVSTPVKSVTGDTRENSLPLSPVRISDGDVSMMDDTAVDMQKDLGFKFPAHVGVSGPSAPLDRPAVGPLIHSRISSQLEAPTSADSTAVQKTGASAQKNNGLSPSPTSEEDVPIPADSKLAEAVVRRDNEQKAKIMAARLKRASFEMAETIYISGVSKEQLQAQMQSEQQNGLAAPPSSFSLDEQANSRQEEPTDQTTSKPEELVNQMASKLEESMDKTTSKPEEPVNQMASKLEQPVTQATTKKEPQVEGGKKRRDTFSLLTRFGLSKLGGKGKPSRSKNDPLPSVPRLDTLPDLTGDNHYSEVDASLRQAILGGGDGQSPLSQTAPYASIDRLQMELRQQQFGLQVQAPPLPPPQAGLDHAAIMQQIASTVSLQTFPSPVVHTRSSSDTALLLNNGPDAMQPQCTLTSMGLKLTTKPVSHTTSLVTIPDGGGGPGHASGSASHVGVIQVSHCENVHSDAVSGVAGKLHPVPPRQADPPSQQSDPLVPQVPHEVHSMPQSKVTTATSQSLESKMAVSGIARRLSPKQVTQTGTQHVHSSAGAYLPLPPKQGSHIGVTTGVGQRATSFRTEAIPAPPASFQTVRAAPVDRSAVESGIGLKLASGNRHPQDQRDGIAASSPSDEVRHLQALGTSAPAGQREPPRTAGGVNGKTGTGTEGSKPPVPPKKVSMPTLTMANGGSISAAPQGRRLTSSATDLQTAAKDNPLQPPPPPPPPRRLSSLKQPEVQQQQQQPRVPHSTSDQAVSEFTSQPPPPKEKVEADKPPMKEKPAMKPKPPPVSQPAPVQRTPSLPQELEKVKPPVKPKPPPVMPKPMSGHLPSKPEGGATPQPPVLPNHAAKGLEVKQFPIPPHPVIPLQKTLSSPPSATAPQGRVVTPTESDLMYDRLSDFWDIPQKVAAEGTASHQPATQSPSPDATLAAQPSPPPTTATLPQAAAGPHQEEATAPLRPYQKSGFYNSLNSISPSPPPTPTVVLTANGSTAGPPRNVPNWKGTGSSRPAQEPSRATSASQAKHQPAAVQENVNEVTDGDRSKQLSLPAAVPQSQSSSSSSSPSSAKDTQSVFLRKMLASSDQSIVPHHMLMVEEAGKGRAASTSPAQQIPVKEPSSASVDTELEDLINELEDEAAAILGSLQSKAADAPQDYGSCELCKKGISTETDAMDHDGTLYHSGCFTCVHCCRSLKGQTVYKINHLLFCEEDYLYTGFRLSTPACGHCKQPIINQSSRVEVQGGIYHTQCVKCVQCGSEITSDTQQSPPFTYMHGHRAFACFSCIRQSQNQASTQPKSKECFSEVL